MANNKPKIIVLFTSYRCNSKCIMCHTWQKQGHSPELSLAQIDNIFSDPKLSRYIEFVNITGGEPTLRKDLPEIVKVLLDKCPNLKRIDMPTNGINTDEVVDKIEQILTAILPTNVKLAVTVSLDGIGDTHEKIRRVPDIFARVHETICEIKEMTGLWSNLLFGLNATISRLNFDKLEEIKDFGLKNGIGVSYTLGAVSEIGVESVKMEGQFSLNSGMKEKVAGFIKKAVDENLINSNYADIFLGYLNTGRRRPLCAFRSRKAFLLEPDGSAYVCGNFKDFYIGNLLEKPFSRIWPNASRIKKSHWKRCFTCESNCYIDEVIR